jgi:ring-1,2-phenylacetyl-CoA epoxidase subunit PaaD
MVSETVFQGIDPVLIPALEQVKDPEIPALSVLDLGMITGARAGDSRVWVEMTPTFVGCPAIGMLKSQIAEAIINAGYSECEVEVNLEQPWTTDRISARGRAALEKFGLAPPPRMEGEELTEAMLDRVRCPHCGSSDTTLRSAFGSTLCRAIRFCFSCKQGFEQFKPV